MISQQFYNRKRLVQCYLGDILHYPIKDASVTLEWYDYILKYGEDIYKISAKLFGEGLEHLWPFILDNNPPRHPDDWRQGDIIKLPRVIIRDSDTQ